MCSRLSCSSWARVRRRASGGLPADFEVVGQPGCGARYQVKRTRDCQVTVGYMRRLDGLEFKSRAVRALPNATIGAACGTVACSDGSKPQLDYDAIVHLRAITNEFEGVGESKLRGKAPPPRTTNATSSNTPFQDFVGPVAVFMGEWNLRKVVYLSAQLARVQGDTATLAERFRERGVVVCRL